MFHNIMGQSRVSHFTYLSDKNVNNSNNNNNNNNNNKNNLAPGLLILLNK